MMSADVTRFWSKVDRSAGPVACWPWTAARAKYRRGYGWFKVDGKQRLAHRVAAELSGLNTLDKFVCHRCDNPSCCNPEHLFVGTSQDNVNDRNSKGRQARGISFAGRIAPIGTRNGRAKLTEDKVREVRAATDPISVLSERYGVCSVVIRKIRDRKLWRHVA